MLSAELAYTLEAAFREAAQRKHAFFCLEHLLFALLFDPEIQKVINNCGGDVNQLRRDLEHFFDHSLERIDSGDPQAGRLINQEEGGPVQTPAVQRVLRHAIMHAHSAGKSMVTATEVLVSIFNESESHAVHFLKKQAIERLDLVNYISHGVVKVSSFSDGKLELEESDDQDQDQDQGDEERSDTQRGSYLKRFTEDLTEQAREGALDPIIGRDKEIDRALRVLSRRQKNNPLFLGDPGVGKTALAAAIAQRIAAGQVPEMLIDAHLFLLNIGSVLAGTKFRGEFEDRLKHIVNELAQQKNAILFIDEIHTIVGAGATGSGSMDAANLLKPALASGKIRCIGSTTHDDYKKSIERDRALSRRFSPIDLREPTIEETIDILRGLKDRFEKHHKIKFSESALKAAAELSAKHINDRFLPDKAIDVIDEAGAANTLLPVSKRKKQISKLEIEEIVSAIARVPVKSVSGDDQKLLQNLEQNLKNRVFGQDQAVSAIALAIKRGRAGLKQEGKPLGCFLFAGPTGVGKTELAKALSQELGVQFHRFDMSEYMEKHSVARLIGAPPGYVGYDEGGILTDLVRKHPYAVLLLDEIEKAHEDIYNILLQVMDDASLTDSKGKKADFRNIILIMTTNAGSEKGASIGFGETHSHGNREEAIKKLFKPEFRNRLDETVYFGALDRKVVERIVDKFISELERQLKSKHISFVLDAEAKEYLAREGFDPLLGARPMARLIQNQIKNPLTEEILFGKLKKGGKVSISVADGKLTFSY